MSCKLLIVLVLAAPARRARAERPIHVDAAGAPFAAGELEAALRVRIPANGAAVRIHVTAIENGVRVESGGAVRDVPLADLHGSDAARLVALAADDLLMDDLAMPPPALPPAQRVSLGVVGGVAGWGATLGSVAVDVVVPRGEYVLAFEAGGGRLFGSTLAVTAADLRASGGLRLGWLEARAGVVLVPVIVTTGAGDVTALVGGSASLRARLPVSSALDVVLGGGVDAFAAQTQYRVSGMPTMTTPRWAPWLALGMEVPL